MNQGVNPKITTTSQAVTLPMAAMHLKNLGFTLATSHFPEEENVISSENSNARYATLGQPLVNGGATRGGGGQLSEQNTPVKSQSSLDLYQNTPLKHQSALAYYKEMRPSAAHLDSTTTNASDDY